MWILVRAEYTTESIVKYLNDKLRKDEKVIDKKCQKCYYTKVDGFTNPSV